jgi:hypothetical protein
MPYTRLQERKTRSSGPKTARAPAKPTTTKKKGPKGGRKKAASDDEQVVNDDGERPTKSRKSRKNKYVPFLFITFSFTNSGYPTQQEKFRSASP